MDASLVFTTIAPLLGALILAMVAPAWTTQRGLRRDLALDAEMLEKLPDEVRAALEPEIRRRGLLLVAMTKYPAATRADLLRLASWVLAVVLISGLIYLSKTESTGPPDFDTLGTFVFVILAYSAPGLLLLFLWVRMYSPWSARAGARLRYILESIGLEEAELQAPSIRLARALLRSSMALVTIAYVSGVSIIMLIPFDEPGNSELTDRVSVISLGLFVTLGAAQYFGDQLSSGTKKLARALDFLSRPPSQVLLGLIRRLLGQSSNRDGRP